MVSGDEQHEIDFEEQEREEINNLLQESISEVAGELGITTEEILETLGDLADVIPHIEPAQVTDLYNEVEESLYEIQLKDINTELTLDDEGLKELKSNLLEFRHSIEVDRRYQMRLHRMINAVRLRAAPLEITGLDGFTQGGPSLDELQRITDGFRKNEAPKVTFSGSVIDSEDGDNVLQSAINKHFSK